MTAPSGIITRIWTVDKKTAEKFLSFEKQPQKGVRGTNRKPSEDVVNRYAFEMLAGHWGFSHQGFAFIGKMADGDADFKDGGQRCRALIQAATVGASFGDHTIPPNPDISIDVMVTEGLDEAAWLVMDIGKGRKPGDFLGMEGEVNTNVLSSTIQLCYQYENEPEGVAFSRNKWNKHKMTPTMRYQYLESNPKIREALYEGARLNKHMTVSAASAAYFLAIKAGVKRELVDEFFDSMFSGTGENWVKGNPILQLREMFANAYKSRRKLTREEQLALFIKAFNAWVRGDQVRGLAFRTKVSSTGAAPEAFPRFQVP